MRFGRARRQHLRRLLACALLALSLGCGDRREPESVRRVVYWEKWTDFEGAAMDRIVDSFNELERGRARREPGYVPIEVQKVTISRIEYKVLVAAAGGNPPDLAGMYSYMMAAYADKGALEDLTELAREAGIRREDYIAHYWDLSVRHGKLWGIPSTPASSALHWNKRLFQEAGLDPEVPPRTIEELDRFAERLTVWEVTLPSGERRLERGYLPDVPENRKRLVQAGFLPTEPGWWNYAWGFFFGADLLHGERVGANAPENLRAYEWAASYAKKLGPQTMRRFRSGFGNFSSPQNSFLSGRVAMVLQGVWMHNFVEKFAPGMLWGAAAFPHPADRPDLANTTIAETDVFVIPKGSRHAREAWEFVKYVSRPEVLERLCLMQVKFPSRREVSEEFWVHHPHPYIRLFRDLAAGERAVAVPQTSVWSEYQRELVGAVDTILNVSRTPEAALGDVQARIQLSVDRERRYAARRGL